jgi:transposase
MDNFKGFLSEKERQELRGFLNRRDFSGREHGRASAILHLDKGKSVPQVAEITFLDEQTIRNFIERYKNGGVDGLLKDEYDGRSFKLTPEQCKELERHLDDTLYMDCQSVINHVVETFGITYSVSGMRVLLHTLGFVYKKPKHVPGKADREVQADFVRRFHELMAQKVPEAPVYFADAVHPTHNSSPAHGWIRRGKEKELVANSGRQRLNIHGALNAETNELIAQRVESVNAQATVELLKAIDAANPSAPHIHLIVDNAGYYHAQAVTDYLKSGESRIQLWFLPPYSPNLNLIERVWKFFRKKVMNNRYYATFKEFTEEALMFFECLSEYTDELRTLLTHNFQLFDQDTEKQVTNAY